MKKSDLHSIALFAGCLLFYSVMYPICDTLGGLITSAMNKKMHSWNMQIEMDEAETKAAVETIQPAPKTGAGAIGFAVPSSTPYDDEIYDKR